MSVAPDVLDKYLKIRALAESSPEAGERANAARLLCRMEKKYPGVKEAADLKIKNAMPRGANAAAGVSDDVWTRLGIDPKVLMKEGGRLILGMLQGWATGKDREVERLLAKVKTEVGAAGSERKPEIELVIAFPLSAFQAFLEEADDDQIEAVGVGLTDVVKELWLDAIAEALDEDAEDEDIDEDEDDEDSL